MGILNLYSRRDIALGILYTSLILRFPFLHYYSQQYTCMMFPTPNYENMEAYKPIIKVYEIQIKGLMAWIRIISMEKYF